MEILGVSGSLLRGNQHTADSDRRCLKTLRQHADFDDAAPLQKGDDFFLASCFEHLFSCISGRLTREVCA